MGKYWYMGLLLLFGMTGTALEIVNNENPAAEIVVAKESHAGTLRAAEDLQYHIEKMSGAKLSIVNASTGKFRNRLFVGESDETRKLGYKLPEFHNSGYDILVSDDYAVFAGPTTFYPKLKYTQNNLDEFWKLMGFKCGVEFFNNGGGAFNSPLKIYTNDDIGPWYAVSAFLEDQGIRFYAPYEDGTIVPERKNISCKNGRTTKEAAFSMREWCYYGNMRTDRDGIAWLKRMKCGSRAGLIFNHTLRTLLQYPETAEAHQEWLAEEFPGKKFQVFGNQCQGIPRFTDPGFQKACAEWAGKLFDAYPELRAVSLGAPDGGNPYDWRDRKKYETKGVSSKQAYANMMWDFHVAVARELKKTHPDKKLIWWCQYNPLIPTNIDKKHLPDNIVFPEMTGGAGGYIMESVRRNMLKHAQEIYELSSETKGPSWEWWLSYASPTYPRYPVFFTKALQQQRKDFRKYMTGVFMEVSPAYQASGEKNPALRGRIGEIPILHLMMYVNMKLLWDPDLDMNALLDEYYRLWFGPAEKEMKKFHQFAEEVWSRPESRSVTETSGFLKEKDVHEYFRLLAEAKAKTAPGTVYYRRIEAMEKGYAPLKKLFPGLKREGPWVRAYRVDNNTMPDGNLGKYKYGWIQMKDNLTGDDVARNRTDVAVSLTEDRKNLLIGVKCYENSMDKLAQMTSLNDDSGIYNDDLVEIYLDTPEKSYFKICVNPAGAVLDESTDVSIVNRDSMPILWNPGVKAVVKKYDDRWELEVRIPTDDFGKLGPTKAYPWGINVCRTRIVDRGLYRQQSYSIAPTGSVYRKQSKWARLWVR